MIVLFPSSPTETGRTAVFYVSAASMACCFLLALSLPDKVSRPPTATTKANQRLTLNNPAAEGTLARKVYANAK